MTKEIKEKVKITQDIFHNILKMIESSNEEDFFIAIESWKNMAPTRRLNMLIYKATFGPRGRDIVRELNLPFTITWSEVWDSFNAPSTTKLERLLFTDLYTEHALRVVNLSCNVKINKINLELQWKS